MNEDAAAAAAAAAAPPWRTRANKNAPSTASQCHNLARWIVGGAILVFAIATIVWENKHLNLGPYATSLEDAFPHFVRVTDESKPKSSMGDINTNDGTMSQRDRIMQHYRTPAQILQSPVLPEWVKQYTAWHKTQRQRYLEAIRTNSTPPSDIRFLISRCLAHDHCGGASDRLQDMPYNIMLANQTQRILLIKWEKPAALEHYLVPPTDGIDWTISDDMFEKGENWHLKGKEGGADKIVSTIRRDSAAPIFRAYEVQDLGFKM